MPRFPEKYRPIRELMPWDDPGRRDQELIIQYLNDVLRELESALSEGGTMVDKTTFVEGEGEFTPIGGVFNDIPVSAVEEDKGAAARITRWRALHACLHNTNGVEIGTNAVPIQVGDASGSLTTDSVDGGHFTIGATTDTESVTGDATLVALFKRFRTIWTSVWESANNWLRVAVFNTVAVSGTIAVSGTTAVSGTINVGNFPATQGVSGTVITNQGAGNGGTSPWAVSGTVETELPPAAALADAVANPTAPAVGAFSLSFNDTTWDRNRAPAPLVELLALAARTAGVASAAQDNYGWDALILQLRITAVAGGVGVTIAFEVEDAVGGWVSINDGPNYTTVAGSSFHYLVYPGATTSGFTIGVNNSVVQVISFPIPRRWRIRTIHSNASSVTYSVHAYRCKM